MPPTHPTHSVAAQMQRNTKDFYEKRLAEAVRWLTQKENYLGAKMLCLLKDSACLNLKVQSCHMWDHGCIKAPRLHSTASSLNASISCTNGYTCWYRPKSSDNNEIAYFHSFTIFTCLKRQLLAISELHTPMAKDRLCFPQQPSRLCHARSRKQQLSANLPIFAFPGHKVSNRPLHYRH